MANTPKFGKKEMTDFLNSLNRKSRLEPDIVAKLRQAFAVGCTIDEACYYAEIDRATYYRWMNKYPQIKRYLDEMRHRLGLKSKENIAKIIESGDVSNSWRYLERTQPKDYAETQKVEHSGEIAMPTEGYPEDEELKREFRERYLQNIINREREKKQNETQSQTKSKTGSQDANQS